MTAGRDADRSDRRSDSDEPALPNVSHEDSDHAWGDEDSRHDDEWYRRERPPHHE